MVIEEKATLRVERLPPAAYLGLEVDGSDTHDVQHAGGEAMVVEGKDDRGKIGFVEGVICVKAASMKERPDGERSAEGKGGSREPTHVGADIQGEGGTMPACGPFSKQMRDRTEVYLIRDGIDSEIWKREECMEEGIKEDEGVASLHTEDATVARMRGINEEGANKLCHSTTRPHQTLGKDSKCAEPSKCDVDAGVEDVEKGNKDGAGVKEWEEEEEERESAAIQETTNVHGDDDGELTAKKMDECVSPSDMLRNPSSSSPAHSPRAVTSSSNATTPKLPPSASPAQTPKLQASSSSSRSPLASSDSKMSGPTPDSPSSSTPSVCRACSHGSHTAHTCGKQGEVSRKLAKAMAMPEEGKTAGDEVESCKACNGAHKKHTCSKYSAGRRPRKVGGGAGMKKGREEGRQEGGGASGGLHSASRGSQQPAARPTESNTRESGTSSGIPPSSSGMANSLAIDCGGVESAPCDTGQMSQMDVALMAVASVKGSGDDGDVVGGGASARGEGGGQVAGGDMMLAALMGGSANFPYPHVGAKVNMGGFDGKGDGARQAGKRKRKDDDGTCAACSGAHRAHTCGKGGGGGGSRRAASVRSKAQTGNCKTEEGGDDELAAALAEQQMLIEKEPHPKISSISNSHLFASAKHQGVGTWPVNKRMGLFTGPGLEDKNVMAQTSALSISLENLIHHHHQHQHHHQQQQHQQQHHRHQHRQQPSASLNGSDALAALVTNNNIANLQNMQSSGSMPMMPMMQGLFAGVGLTLQQQQALAQFYPVQQQ